MTPFVSLLVLVLTFSQTLSQSSEASEANCYDWGVSTTAAVQVLAGQSGFVSCPLFSHPSVYNYSSTQNTGHNLYWYRVLEGDDMEQPIIYSARLSKDRERLWLQPANATDTGQYICLLSVAAAQESMDLLGVSSSLIQINQDDIYPVTSESVENRVALLITNINFVHLRSRSGAQTDEENMEKLLSSLKYEVVKHRDLTAKEMDKALVDFSKHPKLKETDSVFVVIMSQGRLGAVHGVNHGSGETDELPIDNIYNRLNTQNCPELEDKPKIIIIQACRLDESGSVMTHNNVETSAFAGGPINEYGLRYKHKEKDFIALLSCTPHSVSYRHRSEGSILILFTVEVFDAYKHHDHIEELFRKIMRRFEQGHKLLNRMKQMPTKDSNKTSCSRIAMRLTVLHPENVTHGKECPAVAVAAPRVVIPFQDGKALECTDAQEAVKMADSNTTPTVAWAHQLQRSKDCTWFPIRDVDRQVRGMSLYIHIMVPFHQGLYFCIVHYQRKGQALSFTRVLNVTAVNPVLLPKEPHILQPTKDYVFSVTQGEEARLFCSGKFPYLESQNQGSQNQESPWKIWWTIDGKTVEQLKDPRFSKSDNQLRNDHEDRIEESVLIIQDVQPEDLKREFNCSVKNDRGYETQRAQVRLETSLPSLELGCGLGATLLLMLLLFIIYHVFWLELLLLYRSWFGTDERYTDDKEYDVYISYARNSEEEQFVLSTLRSVLENELGYSVCIFDRDSLPGGTITDETLSFVARSRRLLVVVSPGYASRGSQALLELKAGIEGMALGGHLRVILVLYRPVKRQVWVRELRGARVALALVRWQGEKSKELTSRFWKRLRVELPLQRDSAGPERGEKDTALMRMISQNSNSSQTGLISQETKSPQTVYNYAA